VAVGEAHREACALERELTELHRHRPLELAGRAPARGAESRRPFARASLGVLRGRRQRGESALRVLDHRELSTELLALPDQVLDGAGVLLLEPREIGEASLDGLEACRVGRQRAQVATQL